MELPLTGINFHGPKPVSATDVLVYLVVPQTALVDHLDQRIYRAIEFQIRGGVDDS